jgi:oligoendopeptidase F
MTTPTEKITGAESVVWDLSIFYQGIDDPQIEADMARLSTQVDAFAAAYRGRLAGMEDARELRSAVRELEALYELSGRLGSFIQLLYTTDVTNERYGALVQKLTEFEAEQEQKLVFFDLEWSALAPEHAETLLNDPEIGPYRHYLESKLRFKPYLLSEAEEQLLMEKSVTGRSAWTRFFDQLVSSIRYDFNGEKLNQSQILSRLYQPDRDVRQQAQASITDGLKSKSMELTYIFNVLAADKASDDARRKYASWVSSRNLANKAPDAVVDALVTAVTSQYELVARHYRLKRALLGYDELYDYDRYAPMPFKPEGDYHWNDARQLVTQSYADFSPTLSHIVERAFSENWIHAALGPSKRGGAFSAGTTPSAHPFILMNYTGKVRDVMTLAHELGHTVHQYMAGQKQGILAQHTPLTTAEMASTFGEMLVFSRLMANDPNKHSQLALLGGKIEDSFATIFRQVSMNRFENALHTARRSEGELSAERLGDLWYSTQTAMFGDSVTLTDNYRAWWSYIPHFLHTPGYVYAYAFGELLVLALYNIYQTRGAAFVPQYLSVLEAGDSDYPDRILAQVGVNLNDPNFWSEGLQALDKLVTQEEALARELFPEKFG